MRRHWTNVAEAAPLHPELLKVIAEIAPQVVHVHARVGFEEGPQVPDPRAPEYQSHVAGFEHIWSTIWKAQVCACTW